jgi:RNA polymerase sigma factor (sigma-70 family)
MDDDSHLLRLWAREHRQSAFSALVARYAGVVFGTALRRLSGHRALAEEAAQNVFMLMAAKADSLARHPCLGAWLHRAAMWEAGSMDRNEAVHARKLNELAAAMHDESNLPDSSPGTLPDLDAALERLAEPDRRVLILRFFEQCNFREIAKRIGMSEAAAQKRASRALQRLSAQLHRRGITAGTAVVAAALPSLFSQPAPAAVVTRLASTASSASVALSKSATFIQTLSLMAYGKKISLTVAAMLAVCSAVTGGFLLGTPRRIFSPVVAVPEVVVPGSNSKKNSRLTELDYPRKRGSIEPANAAELKDELAAIEAKFEELRPIMTQQASAWKSAHPDVDKWNGRASELNRWELSDEGKPAARALQAWMSEGNRNGVPTLERYEQLARARQKTVVSQLRGFLADPDSAASTKVFLERYAGETQPPDDELERHWNTAHTSMPPRSLVKKILSGVNVEVELRDEPGVPEGVMDYARLDFDNNFQARLICQWVEDSKPESLRKNMASWKDLNVRRFAILEALGFNTNSISMY